MRMRKVWWLVALAACNAHVSMDPQPGQDPPDAAMQMGGGGGGGGADGSVTTPDAPAAFDPTAGIDWFTWPAQQPTKTDPSWGAKLVDIAQHLPAQYGDQYWFEGDGMTSGHETTHGIQAHLRNYEAPSALGWNAFYVTGDKAAFVKEPNMRKADVKAYIPQVLRGDRYTTYVEGQTEWDDTPLYLFDEWTAYCNGADVAIDQVQHSLYKNGWTDAVMGPLEFVVYAIATAQAASVKDPTYFASNDQFKRFTAWQIQRAMQLYAAGSVMDDFKWDKQDKYLADLRTSPDAAALRQFARDTWTAEWVQKTLGF